MIKENSLEQGPETFNILMRKLKLSLKNNTVDKEIRKKYENKIKQS